MEEEQTAADEIKDAEPTHTVAASIKQKPPPESSEAIRIRRLVILSFWAVVICLGLPVWLWTTSIHRATLPLQEMLNWADGKACKPTFPLQIAVEAPYMKESEANHLVRLTQHAIDDLNDFSAHHLRLQLATSSSSTSEHNASMPDTQYWVRDDEVESKEWRKDLGESALTVRLKAQDGVVAAHAELPTHASHLNIYYGPNQSPSTSASSSGLATFIANQLQDLFAEEQAMITYILSQSAAGGQSTGQSPHLSSSAGSAQRDTRIRLKRSLNPQLSAKVENRITKSLKYAPTYHITISLFTPTATPSSWDIEAALTEYLNPLLNSISGVSNFTVDTQVQLYAALSPSVQAPEHDPDKDVWNLRDEDLSAFINAAEWPLSPSIGAGPTLNFILYVPDPRTSPLVIKGSQASSWLIPQWGGVVILNSLGTQRASPPSMLSKESIRPALLTFSHQLLTFLGAPQTPPSLPLQLQTLTRIRAASLLLSASSTMGSLARLTVALPSIAIPETVSLAVDTTLSHLRDTCDALRDGRFRDALDFARVAEAEAEKGFFEKSMVGQVYFPDEHKVAVYLPLLGPVGVPLVMSALKELKQLRAARVSK